MELYNSCPSAFQRRYITKESTAHVKEGTSPAAARGTRVHKGVENYLIGAAELPEEAMAFETMFEKIRDERNPLPEEQFCYDEDWVRVPFTNKERGRVRGILDIVYEHEGMVYVQELKTGKLYDEHAKQRSLYGLAGLLMFPGASAVTVQTIYLDPAIVKPLVIERGQIDSYKYMWERNVNKVQPPQDYPARKNWKCAYCPYNADVGGKCLTGKK